VTAKGRMPLRGFPRLNRTSGLQAACGDPRDGNDDAGWISVCPVPTGKRRKLTFAARDYRSARDQTRHFL